MGNNKSVAEADEKLNFYCFCCGQLLERLTSIACPFHLVCDDCEVLSFSNKFTVCCLNDISPDAIRELKNKYGMCKECNIIVGKGFIPICDCILCSCCVSRKSKIYERECKTCLKKFVWDKFITCFACNQLVGKINSVYHGCGQSICKKCIKQESSTLFPESNVPNTCCLSCLQMYDERTLKELYGEEKTNEIFRLNSFSIYQDNRITCPNCGRSYIRDSKNIFQECIDCKFTLCTECSAFKDQIDCHGPHYHEPNCKFYIRSNQETQYNVQCSICKETKKPCKPPTGSNRQRFWSA